LVGKGYDWRSVTTEDGVTRTKGVIFVFAKRLAKSERGRARRFDVRNVALGFFDNGVCASVRNVER
jgi:hypothetical protein